jgi:Protein of unknown function (DUF1232)
VLGVLIAYVALPFDLVPDFISVAGQLDVSWPPVRSARGLDPAHDAGALVGKVAASRDERRGG